MAILDRFVNLVNAFQSYEIERPVFNNNVGPMSSGATPHQARPMFYNDKSIITSIYTRIAIDVAAISIRHVQLDEIDRYSKNIDSPLNRCFDLEANIDQAPRDFRQDLITTLFDKGVAAVVPVDTMVTNNAANGFDVLTMRVGEITAWYHKHIRVSLFNEKTQMREEITVPKRTCAIVQNPLYAVMNAPNSTLQRLIRKLQLIDSVDEASSSGKLDLIIQLPYVIKSEARKQQAKQRRDDIEFQLKGSKYGIAYTDGTEKITQLNRPTENNLLAQIEKLQASLYGQLGITDSIMNGTADEATMINYWNRTIEPILDSVVEAFQRAFLGARGTAARQRIKYFRNPFKLIPIGDLAETADKFTRNEILTSNEFRAYMGIPPSTDPKADELRNSNMPQPELGAPVEPPAPAGPSFEEMDELVNSILDGVMADLDSLNKTDE